MATLSDLLERVHDEFPGAPEGLALRALSDATKEFCTLSHAWQETLPRVSIRAGVTSYVLYPDTGVQIVALKEVRLDERRIPPLTVDIARTRAYTPDAGTVMGFMQTSPTTIELINAPDSAERLAVKAALTLARGETDYELPDALLDEYGEGIAAGAKMRLVRMAGQPWFAPDAARIYAPVFYGAANSAKVRAMTSMGEADAQIEMRPWV